MMDFSAQTFVAALLLCLCLIVQVHAGGRLDNRTKTEDFLDICMLGTNHKSKPGPEADLFKSCQPWESRSCCHQNTTHSLHTEPTWYNFDWNHCEGRALSDKCKKHFIDDLCFFECSPNVGPWLVATNRKWTSERFAGVPLCDSVCQEWWNDCRGDFTCRDNWYTGFDWSTGTNKCKPDAKCQTFEEVFGGYKNFCENVWDGSWKVVPDSDKCMHISWTAGDNPNEAVAAMRAKEIVDAINSGVSVQSQVFGILAALVLSLFV